ncbi:hypothetical protein K8T06_10980, partial [bacterium]|nr:hypothetical protein [bacterium]
YLYGGRTKEGGIEKFADSGGEVWSFDLDQAYDVDRDDVDPPLDASIWYRHAPDRFRFANQVGDYPPAPRYAHAAVACQSLDISIMHSTSNPTQLETYLNYVVFGGMKQETSAGGDLTIAGNEIISDEVFVFAEYRIQQEDPNPNKDGIVFRKRYHWYELEREGNETWPSPRKYAQIVPLFNEQDPVDCLVVLMRMAISATQHTSVYSNAAHHPLLQIKMNGHLIWGWTLPFTR